MKIRLFVAIFMTAAVLFGVLACVHTPERAEPIYKVRAENFESGLPRPQPSGVQVNSSRFIGDQVEIDPAEVVGYGSLPTTVTQPFAGRPRDLSLMEVVTETLANNRTIKIQDYSLRIAEYDIPVSKAIYDLLITGTVANTRTEEQSSTSRFGALPLNSARTRNASLGLQQLLPSGAVLTMGYEVIRQWSQTFTIDPATFQPGSTEDLFYQHVARLGLRQPLLQGFGPRVTNAGIRISTLQRQAAAAGFQNTVERKLLQALQFYWELIGAVESHKVAVISYAQATDLLRVNRAKYEAEVLPRTDVLQAEAAVADRREQLIQARRAVRDLEDQLKRQLFLRPDRPQWERQIRPSQRIGWRQMELDLEDAIQQARQLRPEIRQARSVIEQAKTRLTVSRNKLLPELNLFGEINSNGLGDGFDEGYQNANDASYTGYTVGLEVSYPLQNRRARYQLRQSEVSLAQAEEQLLDLEDQITLELRQAERALRTARERIEVTQSRVRSEQAKLDAELKRYDVGMSTAFEVLTFQDDLAMAQNQHIRAVIDYNKAMLNLERARGTLLDTYGITIEGPDLDPSAASTWMPLGMDG